MANTIAPITIELFLFTPRNYPCADPFTAEFGKMLLRIQETLAAALLAGPLDTM